MTDPVRTAEELSAQSKHWANYDGRERERERERGRGMTRSKAVGSAQGLKGSVQIQCAVEAETLFFYWLWRKE